MKKSKILVPAIALLALGVAGSTVGTVAWFQATAASTSVAADTANVETISGVTNTDAFEVTAVLTGSLDNIYLTNDAGETKLIVNNENVVVTPSEGTGYKTLTVNAKVDYTGSGSPVSADYVLSAWKETVKASGINFTVTDTSTGLGAGAGLKFWTAAPTSSWAGEASVSVNCTKPVATAVTFTGSGNAYSADIECNLAVYVGVKGVDDLVQESTDAYQLTVTPAFGA